MTYEKSDDHLSYLCYSLPTNKNVLILSIEHVIRENEFFVTGIQFHFDGIELTFLEQDEQSSLISLGKVMSVEVQEHDDELLVLYERLQDAAIMVINRSYEDLRNPPPLSPTQPVIPAIEDLLEDLEPEEGIVEPG